MILLICRDITQAKKAESIWNDKEKFKCITIGSILLGYRFERAIFLFDVYREIVNSRWTPEELVSHVQTKLLPNAQVEFL